MVELIGKCRKQHDETGWFVCVDHVEARGRPLLRAGPAVAPPPLPEACRHATVLRPVKRRVEVLGYSQERTLYGTVDAVQGGVAFRPQGAPKPQNVSPDDLEFSAEGEAARCEVEEWLGKGARAAAVHKAAGGDAFVKEEYDAAVASYTSALEALREPADGGEGKGLAWGGGAPVLKAEALVVTLLSNRAESHLRAAAQLANESQIRHQARAVVMAGADDPDGSARTDAIWAAQMAALTERYDAHICAAMADAAEALDIGLDPPESSITKKSERRLYKAHRMMAEQQAVRLGDSVRKHLQASDSIEKRRLTNE